MVSRAAISFNSGYGHFLTSHFQELHQEHWILRSGRPDSVPVRWYGDYACRSPLNSYV